MTFKNKQIKTYLFLTQNLIFNMLVEFVLNILLIKMNGSTCQDIKVVPKLMLLIGTQISNILTGKIILSNITSIQL